MLSFSTYLCVCLCINYVISIYLLVLNCLFDILPVLGLYIRSSSSMYARWKIIPHLFAKLTDIAHTRLDDFITLETCLCAFPLRWLVLVTCVYSAGAGIGADDILCLSVIAMYLPPNASIVTRKAPPPSITIGVNNTLCYTANIFELELVFNRSHIFVFMFIISIRLASGGGCWCAACLIEVSRLAKFGWE